LTGGGSSGAVTVGIQDALTTQKGAVQLSDSTSTTSSILAATPTAVKSAYDLADAAIAKSTLTTAGDVIYRNATVPVRLAIGTANQVLTVNAGATAPEWKTPAGGGGKVLQVVSTTSTTTVSNSTSTFADSNLSLSITPTLATSKVLVLTSQVYNKNPGNQYTGVKIALNRGATQLALISENTGYLNADGYNSNNNIAYNYLDSPATTSATTYKVRFCNNQNAASVAVSANGTEVATMILMEIGA
jgi:hypothetical protein